MSLGGGIVGLIKGDSFEDSAKEAVEDYSLGYNLTGMGASDAAEESSKRAADAQQEALNYLKDVEAVPQQFRTEGTRTLGGLYGLGTPEQQAASMDAFNNSAVSRFYSGLGDTRLKAQEDAIARHAAATGGLRSGSTQAALAEN